MTAEALMRSRYSAFAIGDVEHLHRSWDPRTRPHRIRLDPQRRWTGLEVLATAGGGMLDEEGTVEFLAHHRDGSEQATLHEVSRFRRIEGTWVYVAGIG